MEALQKIFQYNMLLGANEVEIGKQWSNNKLLTSLSKQRKFFGCLTKRQLCNSSF